MTALDASHFSRVNFVRLASFVVGAFAANMLYYYLVGGYAIGVSFPLLTQLLLFAIPMAGCFAGTLLAGFWSKDSGVFLRFLVSVLCFAIPVAAFLVLLDLTWKCANPCVP